MAMEEKKSTHIYLSEDGKAIQIDIAGTPVAHASLLCCAAANSEEFKAAVLLAADAIMDIDKMKDEAEKSPKPIILPPITQPS